ncbi:iron chelate uptake ABC transporter family permease subunit [Acrocarpospora macrocephala]|uniref:Iron ABC transporter permease n=1 Tax=Acrocarpospora macrocephala TaxID=150177 RepID=A0A5M3WJM2_9ACTN|nr:iron ABC transporter permease [Acrocarpospora macrocephala]GES08826.1 iron ABC transporter permease [Acrocarpospora macrocephala]
MTQLSEAGPITRGPSRAWSKLLLVVALLLVAIALSLALGSRSIPLAHLLDWQAAGDDQRIIRELRLPRTLIGLLAGVALGLAGALMQGVSRNPIADPGLLGINAGSALAVVVAITWFDVTSPSRYVWFAFLGGVLAAGVVYGVGSFGIDGGSPLKLTLVGAALTAVVSSFITLILLSNTGSLAQFRFWQVGSLAGRDLGMVRILWPFVLAGIVLSFASARGLNLLALGDDLARGLGQSVAGMRLICLTAVVLLSGAATALAGPIVFVGLVAPHIARHFAGPDYRWIMTYTFFVGPALLLAADVAGRLVVPPGELEAGLAVALIGAPLMIVLVRRLRLGGL